MEPPTPDRIGICCSGGGIRSAAFNLGALQELRKANTLSRASFITAVSGGSYIASAHAIAMNSAAQFPSEGPAYSEGSPEERFLRNHTSYLAPGFMGKVRLGLRLFFGIIWNLAFVGLTLYLLAIPTGWFYRAADLGGGGTPSWALVLTISPLLIAASFGSVGRLFRLGEGPNRFLEVWSTRLLVLAAISFVLLIAFPAAINWIGEVVKLLPKAGTLRVIAREAPGSTQGSGLVSILYLPSIAGLTLGALRALLKKQRLAPNDLAETPWIRRAIAKFKQPLLVLGASILGPLLILIPFLFFAYDARSQGFPGWALFDASALIWGFLPQPNEAGWYLVCLGSFAVIYGFADLTQWSMHPFYRRQLSSVFAVERVPGPTGCRPQANEMDYNAWSTLSESQPDGFPHLIVCAAANVSDEGATPTGTDITSFTFSSNWIGGPLVGWMATGEFEEAVGNRRRDLTLRAAVAMSGAAISPSMGRMTRRSLRFLMALANVRLGVWVPNPMHTRRWQIRNGIRTKDGKLLSVEERLRRSQGKGNGPRRRFLPKPVPIRPRPYYLFKEMLGINRFDDKFLYITDGGHYENLGLVELLRRGCTKAWCIDASGDSGGSFGTLGQAVAIARSELGVEISIDAGSMSSDDEGISETGHAIGSYVFTRVPHEPNNKPEGKLVFIKASLVRDMPADLKAFRSKDFRFPNHPTSHQLFHSDEFEAYRALGAWLTRKALEDPKTGEMPQTDRRVGGETDSSPQRA